MPSDHHRPIGQQDSTIAISPADDALLFNAKGEGERDLYELNLKTFIVTRIAETPEYETAPSYSPDSKRIVYAAGVPGDRADHIFVIGRNGSAKTQLTDIDANDTSPRFSPDGKSIVFVRDKTHIWGGLAANWDLAGVICLIDDDGGNLRQLTADDMYAFDPHFSSDGADIVFSTPSGLMSVPVDGSAMPRQISRSVGAVPSPDGNMIANSKGKYSPDQRVFVANTDGTSERVLTPNLGGCTRPVFTNACDKLYFLREEWPNGGQGVPKFSVWEAAVDGTKLRRITDVRLFDDPLSWKSGINP